MLLASGALAWWQYHEYRYERELSEQTLGRQADSLANALIGGIRSHRNRGHFFADQLQGSLAGLVEAPDILTVAILGEDGRLLQSAGDTELLQDSLHRVSGTSWDASGFRLVEWFELPAVAGGAQGGGGRGRNGPGWWRLPATDTSDHEVSENPFPAEGQAAVVLILDCTETDARCRRAAWLRASVVAAGVLVLFCVSLAWRVAVRTAARARLLEAEARHFRDLSQAAAGLAHETRNPLGLIRGWTQRLAQSGLPSPEQEQQAEAIVEECDRVTSRINQFLTFARPADPKPESVQVTEVMDELALLLEPDLDAKNLKLVYAEITSTETLRADRELLRQALFNLIQNAVQASRDGDTIEISVRRGRNGGRQILIADHGSGVATEAVESLFTPYFTTRADGTGLGLAIVRRIAGAHGWEVGYTRRAGGGSVFCLDRIHV